MLLAIDIGNTNINCGLFMGARIIKRFHIPTARYSLGQLKRKISRAPVSDAVVCSVVPKMTAVVARDLAGALGRAPYIIGKEIKIPIKNRYRIPAQVGADRLVNAYAGINLYGAPLIVVDFGTAVTFDLISRNKEYLGGMILPGLQLSLDALSERAALLPRMQLAAPREFIGKDTKNSMISGISFGFSALVDSLVARIKQKIGRQAKVIFTGGDAGLMARMCRSFDYRDNDLTITGIYLAHSYAKKAK